MMSSMIPKGFVVTIFLIFYFSHAHSGSFADADVASKGTFSLSHAQGDTKAVVSISVRSPKIKESTRSIGNFNSLLTMSIFVDGLQISIPKECKSSLLDINYIRLENMGSLFRFWVQGGDGSESYQVAYTFTQTQPLKCKFLSDANDASIEPMFSKKELDALSRNIKK